MLKDENAFLLKENPEFQFEILKAE